jgi:hypothetical protein
VLAAGLVMVACVMQVLGGTLLPYYSRLHAACGGGCILGSKHHNDSNNGWPVCCVGPVRGTLAMKGCLVSSLCALLPHLATLGCCHCPCLSFVLVDGA